MINFFPEELFLFLLTLEQKRCQRSEIRFALALFDVAHLEDWAPFCDELCSKLRETDIAGWYSQSNIIGTIFTSLNGAPALAIRAKLESKIGELAHGKIPFGLYIFPEDIKQELYPDIFTSKSNSLSALSSAPLTSPVA